MNKYMKVAIDLSRDNLTTNVGGPFGACIVLDGKIVGKGSNHVLSNNDPTAHAEVMAIRDACKNLNTYDLSGCTLYTSCYPCPMCLSAIMWSNIKTVYYGNTKEDADNIGFRDDFIYDFIYKMQSDNMDRDVLNLECINRDEALKVFNSFDNKSDKTIYQFMRCFMNRCSWCNLKNDLYIDYHDNEWGVLNTDDRYLFEMLILESFQAGLSWECVLNKREAFRIAYDNFDIEKVINYDNDKINSLLSNDKIIRNKLKILASINNAKIFKSMLVEYNGFYNYLKQFTSGNIFYENDKSFNDLSDNISNDLKKRGMKFVGSTIIYSYLQAIGVINSHDNDCYKYNC